MPRIIKTIDEYTAVDRKRETYFMVFNTVYNDVHAFKKEPESDNLEDMFSGYLNKDYTDNNARKEFLEFMKENFPNVKLIDVFDFVSVGYMIYPYLGTIAIDCEKNDEVYNALCKKYEDEDGKPKSNKAVFWALSYELALKGYNERKEFWDAELEE